MTHTFDTGKSLRIALAMSNMTRKDFADQMHMTPTHVSRLATGNQQIGGETLSRVAAVFGMKASEFLALGED